MSSRWWVIPSKFPGRIELGFLAGGTTERLTPEEAQLLAFELLMQVAQLQEKVKK